MSTPLSVFYWKTSIIFPNLNDVLNMLDSQVSLVLEIKENMRKHNRLSYFTGWPLSPVAQSFTDPPSRQEHS